MDLLLILKANPYHDEWGRFTFAPGGGNKVPDATWFSSGKIKVSLDGRFEISPKLADGTRFPKGQKVLALYDHKWNHDSLLQFPYVMEFLTDRDAKREANKRLELIEDF